MIFSKQEMALVMSFLLYNFVIAFNVSALESDKKPYLQSTQDPIDSLLPMLGGLLVIIVFIFFLAYLFKRFSNLNTGTRLISIVESYAIGHKEKLAIVKVENECFLIGITASSINPIGKLDSLKLNHATKTSNLKQSSGADEGVSIGAGFAPLIAKFMSGDMTADIANKKENTAGKNAL
jgi:flagellar biosynthetic protein FliO